MCAIYRQQKVLSHFPVCCWIDWLLMIKNCLNESGPPCRTAIRFRVKLKQTGTERFQMLENAYGEKCLSRTSVFQWRNRLKEGLRM
jgi:hypothetical protein